MKPAERALMNHLARVDWIRAGQRLLVFCREIRGDQREAIDQDHARALSNAQQLRTTIERFAERLTKGV